MPVRYLDQVLLKLPLCTFWGIFTTQHCTEVHKYLMYLAKLSNYTLCGQDDSEAYMLCLSIEYSK